MVGSAVMKQFLDEVEGIKMDIAAVAEARAQIAKMGERAASEHSESEVVKIQNSVSDTIENINRRALKCRQQLHSLKKNNEQLENGENIKSCDLRMRVFVIDTLVVSFVEEMVQYQTAQLLNKRRLTAQLQKISGNVVNDRLKNHWVQQTATQGLPDDMRKNKTPVGGDRAPSAKLATAHADKSKSIETNEVGQVQTANPAVAKEDSNQAHASKSNKVTSGAVNDRIKAHWVQQTKPQVLAKAEEKEETLQSDSADPAATNKEIKEVNSKQSSQETSNAVNDRLKSHWVQQKQNGLSKSNDKKNEVGQVQTAKPGVAKKESNKAGASKPNKVTSNTVDDRIKAHWMQQTEPPVLPKAKEETVEMPVRTDDRTVDNEIKQTNTVNNRLKAHWVPQSEQFEGMHKPNNKDQKPKQDADKQIDDQLKLAEMNKDEDEKTLPVSSEQLSIDYGNQMRQLVAENKWLVDEIKALRDGHAGMAKQLQTLSQKVAVMSAERDELQQPSNTKIEKLQYDLDEETLRETLDLESWHSSNASIEKLQDDLYDETPFRVGERETLDLLTRLDALNNETEGLLAEFQELSG